MSIVKDLVQAADGCLVLVENAHPSQEYVCPTCAQRLQYKITQEKGFFSHPRGKGQACRATVPKTNYHRVLTKCQTQYNWKLYVECGTPACKNNVGGPYHVSREGAYKIIVRALRMHEYHVKAGCGKFQILAVFCDACKGQTGTTRPPHRALVPTPDPTTIADAQSVATQATTTRRAAALSANTALDQHVSAQNLETTTGERSQNAAKILAAATTTEKEAVANVNRVREANNAAAELERRRVAASEAAALERVRQHQQERVEAGKVAARVQAFGQIEARIERGANSTVSLVHQWEWLEAETVAVQELERVASESVGGTGTENAPAEIKDLERPNVTGELRAERTRLRVQTEREEREAAETAIGERVRAAAEARNAERLQAAIDATKASLVSDVDWKIPEVLTPEEPCYACNGSGTSYWCEGDYGSCLVCCCINCTKWNSACNCTEDYKD